jgi:ATP-dependent DNA ligase
MLPLVLPQLVGGNGPAALGAAIADPERYAVEPKVDGVRGLLTFTPEHVVEMRNRHGVPRHWFRGDAFEAGFRRLAGRLPILWKGPVLDGVLTTGRFGTTMSALLYGSSPSTSRLAGVDVRPLPWDERRERLELVAGAFDVPLELSPIVEPSRALAIDITDGRLERLVLKDRPSRYKDGTRAGWSKVNDPRWFERESWRFDRR